MLLFYCALGKNNCFPIYSVYSEGFGLTRSISWQVRAAAAAQIHELISSRETAQFLFGNILEKIRCVSRLH